MLDIHICDDENFEREKTKEILNAFAHDHQIQIRVSVTSSLKELEQHIFLEGNKPDILFLDIEFDEEQETSIRLAEKIGRELPSCSIAFLTNHLSYATDVYTANHFYYVIKGELESRLDAILKRYYERSRKIILHTKKMEWCFESNDIMYVERARRCCYVFLADGDSNKISLGFEQVAAEFDQPMFIRCHNSFLINLNYLQQYLSDTFVLKNGKEIPISRSYQKACHQAFLKWQEIWV
ncbi:MAG: response regulator transcription factor [Eubacterium sp.]|nr:response regulator transcription factor [Eubacterium sp.]